MLILRKFSNKLKLINKGEFSFKDLFWEITSHVLNFCKFQRYLRRKTFFIEKVICNSININDSTRYWLFLSKHSVSFRKENNKNYYKVIPYLNSKNFYHVARLRDDIIGGVGLCCTCRERDSNFWFISGLIVLRYFQGRGVGERLVHSICSYVVGENDVIYLTVDRLNFRAQNLYKKLGFQEDLLLKDIILQVERYKSVPQDLIFLFKRLNLLKLGD